MRLQALSILAAVMFATGCDQINSMRAPAVAPAPQAPAAAPVAAAAVPSAPTAAAAGGAAVTEVNPEVKAHIRQGFAYVSTAKNAANPAGRAEAIENAINEFSQAISKAPNYAEAYSNRAVGYMLQGKYNKAEEDLMKAKQLNPESASIRYNLASLYSLQNKVDLALDEIDAALSKGFTDYDALRKDPDLDNARNNPEFRKVLEKHKVFIVK
jgi:tetratricopeptide (TPR) repeat protein